jgi:hypothetical protein
VRLGATCLLAFLLSGCCLLVPGDFRKAETEDAADLTVLVQNHMVSAESVDEAEAWREIGRISGRLELRARWLRGEPADFRSSLEER